MKGRWARVALVLAGGGLAAGVGLVASVTTGVAMVAGLQRDVDGLIGHAGVKARFIDRYGYLTRRPMLSGGERLGDERRARLADGVAALPGVAGAWWGKRAVREAVAPKANLECQSTVEAILKSRSIRFAQDSASIDASSREALDEVAGALRPCVGSIIAITGHTDAEGDEARNLALSAARAIAVRNALAARGLDMAGLRARGLGSARPLPGLDGADPANRRIEFSVIAPVSLEPSVVDTPGPG